VDCPSCETTLQRAKYEKFYVFQCPDCSGVLLNIGRLPFIKTGRGLSTEELQSEVEIGSSTEDTREKVRCPRCRGEGGSPAMDKMESRKLESTAELFLIDVCKSCRLAWFNGGELARLQLAYESTPKAIAELQMQLQAESRTEEEEEELREDLAQLPGVSSTPIGDFIVGTLFGKFIAPLIVSVVLFRLPFYLGWESPASVVSYLKWGVTWAGGLACLAFVFRNWVTR
jgi:Zn-finger nucleic acid-binding protein